MLKTANITGENYTDTGTCFFGTGTVRTGTGALPTLPVNQYIVTDLNFNRILSFRCIEILCEHNFEQSNYSSLLIRTNHTFMLFHRSAC